MSALLVLFLVVWPFYGFAPAPWFLAAVVAGWSLIDSLAAIQMASYRRTSVPATPQGCVNSVYRLLIFGTLTFSQAMIGLGLQYWGVLPAVGAL